MASEAKELNKISMPISKPLTKCTAEKIVYRSVVLCFFPFGRENVDALG